MFVKNYKNVVVRNYISYLYIYIFSYNIIDLFNIFISYFIE